MNKSRQEIPRCNQPRRLQMPANLVLAVLVLAGGDAWAQGSILEEVVVTAQKREQSIQDVGIAITAFTGEQIDKLGLITSTDLVAMSPGVHVGGSLGHQFKQFSIRGVTQNDIADVTEAPNAVYVDDAYMAPPQAQLFGLYDMERVEILKGPQGTLFGRNATGGLVHFITRKPTDTFEAFADFTYGSYDQIRGEGAVSGPLTDTLSGRLSIFYNKHDGILNNIYPFGQPTIPGLNGGQPLAGSVPGPSDFWDDDQWAVRGQLLWAPSEDVEFLLSVNRSYQQVGQGAYQSIATTAVFDAQNRHVNTIFAKNEPIGCEALAPGGGCAPIVLTDGEFFGGVSPVTGGPVGVEDFVRPVPGGDLYGYIDPDGEDLDTSADHAPDGANKYHATSVTAKGTWDLNEQMTVTWIGHYVDSWKIQTLDTDAGPAPALLATPGPIDVTSWTQELRINGETDRTRWVAGLYYLNNDVDFRSGFGYSPQSPITLTLGGPINQVVLANLQTDSYSIFGQMEYDLTDQWTVTAGIRGILEEKEYDYANITTLNFVDQRLEPGGFHITVGNEFPSFADTSSDPLWTGKIQLDYQPNDDWLFYAGINRGVKAGGFNAQVNDGASAPLPAAEIPYDEEVLWAYELGFKSTLWDGRAQLNAGFYYYDYQDYQAFVWANVSGTVRNADAEYKGVEADLHVTPVDNFDLIFNVSFNDAKVKDLPVAPVLNLPGVPDYIKDVRPTFTPSVQLSGLARYAWPNSLFGGTLAAQLTADYGSSMFHTLRNFAGQKMPGDVTGNARLSWTSADERWDGSFFVNNFTDTRRELIGFDLSNVCGCNLQAISKPRWFGVQVRYTHGE